MVDASAVVKPVGITPMTADKEVVRDHHKSNVTPINLGPFVDAIMEHIRERVTIANIRTLFACIGVGESIPFNMPPKDQIVTRLKSNGDYFLTNYMLITTCVFFFLLFFFHPIQLIVCILVACGWYVVLTKKHSQIEHYPICGERIGQDEILLAITASTIIFLVFFIMPTIVFASSTSTIGCAVHALLRNNRLKDDDSYSTAKLLVNKTVSEELV